MCGIAGLFHLDGKPCDSAAVVPLIDAIAHRGPDGDGVYVCGPVGLGHRRLAILDLSESGKQPMTWGNRYCITYNGEIYNFVELRQELESLGHTFRTDCDTEVLLAAYHQWGPDFVLKMNGMWAFAIWDMEKHELFLSRDRFGVKPLLYLAEPDRFVFASELKAFLHVPGFTAREDLDETRRQLATGIDSPERTLIAGVKQLRPGHNILISRSGMRIWRWWYTLDHLVPVPKRFDEQVEQFRELFFDACRLRLRSDVPVATCLSGGIDSSSILCALAAMKSGTSRMASDYHRAFVATFEGTAHDEKAYAVAAIEAAKAEARYRPMTPAALLADLTQYAYDYDVIGGGQGLLLPVWALYRELRRDGVIVSLDGLGADELLVGYPRSIRTYLETRGNLITNTQRTIDLAQTLQKQVAGESLGSILSESDPVLRRLRRTAGQMKRWIRPVEQRTKFSPADWIDVPWSGSLDSLDAKEHESLKSLTPLSQEMYRLFHHEANWLLLQRYDRISMAHGIEVRLPFLDWRLVVFCFSLPDESKIGEGYSKRILREAMRGILPEKIRTRTRKIGFQSPMGDWMNAELGAWALDRAHSQHFLQAPVSNGPAIRDYIMKKQAEKSWDGRDSRIIWRHMQADLWREAFFEKAPALDRAARTVN